MDIKQEVEYGLQGQFKVDIYNQEGGLVDSTDYFDNFVTHTGLNYPYYYNFSDCFRFLSLGKAPYVNEIDTTGLAGDALLALVKNKDTNNIQWQNWTWLGDEHLDKQGDASAGSCGTHVSREGPQMFRGWALPTGENNFTESETTISEFMVSPSSGTDPTGMYAFSRVPRNVVIPSGTRTIVTYMLQVLIKNIDRNYFYGGGNMLDDPVTDPTNPLSSEYNPPGPGYYPRPVTFNVDQAERSQMSHLVDSFGSLSGYYRQCYHGIRCVDNQGRTFIPHYGDPMEPSNVNLDKIAIYFSPENSQFDVNIYGGAQSSETDAYATDGLLALSFNHNLDKDAGVSDAQVMNNAKMSTYNIGDQGVFSLISNIRLNPSTSQRPPTLADYRSTTSVDVDLEDSNYTYLVEGSRGDEAISMATYGKEMLDANLYDRGFQAAHSSMMSNIGIDFAGEQANYRRKRKIRRKAFITPINALGHNSRFGSMVYAYKNGSTFYPAVDCMFFDSSGRSVMQHYRRFSGVYLSERGRGIADCYLTTEPRTYGGFYVRGIQGPVVYDPTINPGSEKLTSDITGYSGWYADGIASDGYTPIKATAVRIPGNITPGYTVPGDTGPKVDTVGDPEEEGYHTHGKVTLPDGSTMWGLGALQGHMMAAEYDFGITDHRVPVEEYEDHLGNPQSDLHPGIMVPPVVSQWPGDPAKKQGPWSNAAIYWPNMEGGKLDFAVSGLQYYDAGIGRVNDFGSWLAPSFGPGTTNASHPDEGKVVLPDWNEEEKGGSCSDTTKLNELDCVEANATWTTDGTSFTPKRYYSPTFSLYFDTSEQCVSDIIMDTDVPGVNSNQISYDTAGLSVGLDTFENDQLPPFGALPLARVTQSMSLGKDITDTLVGGQQETVGFFLSRSTGQLHPYPANPDPVGGYTRKAGQDKYEAIDWDSADPDTTAGSKRHSVALTKDIADLGYQRLDNNGVVLNTWITGYLVDKALYSKFILNTTWMGGGECSNNQARCEDGSNNAAPSYTNKQDCEANANHTWYPGNYSSETDCTAGGGTWTAAVDPTDPANYIMQFPVQVRDQVAYIGLDESTHKRHVGVVSRLMDGFGDYTVRGTNFGARLSGKGFSPSAGDSMSVFFTGLQHAIQIDNPYSTDYGPPVCVIDGTTDSQYTTQATCEAQTDGVWKTSDAPLEKAVGVSDPLFLMAGWSNLGHGEGLEWDWYPTCEFQGEVSMTDFKPPAGYFLHEESYKLLPNFATGQVNNDAYPRDQIKQGGVYPGMSNLNTLEVYMDITWSAPCAGVSNCVEP